MSVYFGEKEYQSSELSKEDFYKLLKNTDALPHTSQPSPQSFMNVFQEAMDNGEETVMITISSELSGTYQGAALAKDMLEYNDCYIVDSLSATVGERILVEHAVKLRDEGKTAAEIVSALEALRSKITICACVDTLEYLHKGGRISGASYAVGTLAHVKPIITVTPAGKVDTLGKAIGKVKGIRFICERLESSKPDTNYPIYLVYSDTRENAMRLMDNLKKQGFEIPEENMVHIGPVIGTHVVPDAFGVVYISE